MKPGHKAPAPTVDVAALALAAAFTAAAALVFYGARGARSLERLFAPAPAATVTATTPGAPLFTERPAGAPSALPGAKPESSPLPFSGEEFARRDEATESAAPQPAAPAYPDPAPPRRDDGLKSVAAQPAAAPFEPPRLQPIQNLSGYLSEGTGESGAFLAAGAGPAPAVAAKGPQAPAFPTLPNFGAAPSGSGARGAAKPRARANGAQGATSAISFGTP